MSNGKVKNENALDFLLAGNCETTIVSHRTGNKFTYKIKRSNNKDTMMYFLHVVKNRAEFAGVIVFDDEKGRFNFYKGKKGTMDYNYKEIKAILYVLNSLLAKKFNIGVDIYHCGYCGRCGRKLTDPKSIMIGLGPKCAKVNRPYVY